MMYLRLVFATLAIAAVAQAAETKPPSEGDQSGPSLQGIWTVMSMENAGRKLPADRVKTLRFVFSEDKLTMRIGDQAIAETKYAADQAVEPATIRLTFEGEPTLGIYRVEGDDLKICLSGSTEKRPSQFVSEADSANRMLIVLKRGDLGPIGWPLFVAGVDGTGLRQLAEQPKDMGVGSPDWSPDGSKIAFDGWRLARGENYVAAHIYVVNTDGKGLKDIAVGAMPSWSPDGKRITYCQYSPNSGVWIMDTDGSNQKLVDSDGWGSDWSPTENEIVYRVYSDGANLCVVNPDTDQRRILLKSERYNSIYWNMSWSADGKNICFVGIRADDVKEIATVSAEGETKGFKVLLSAKDSPQYKSVWPIVAWDGNAHGILASMRGPDDKCRQLYVLDPGGTDPPKRFAGQDPNRHNADMAWSPDGKMAVFNSRVPE